jgi:DNA-binding NarL/FixJ family response regulator
MKLNDEDARLFSRSLLRIHTAAHLQELGLVRQEEEARHAAARWMVGLLRAHVRQRAEQLHRRTAAPGLRLTARERQVLERIAQGDTDAAAGRALGIATRTVSKHVENILQKLGVETRTAAVQSVRR